MNFFLLGLLLLLGSCRGTILPGHRKLPTSCTTSGIATCFADSSNGDEIEISPGTMSSWDGLHSLSQLKLASKYVSIACSNAIGEACIWQGATGKRVVFIQSNGGTTTLSFLVIKNGDASADGHNNGGGLYVLISNVVLIVVSFIDNAASNYGGAIDVYYSGSSSLTLHGCSFSGNTATETGGPDIKNTQQTVVIGGCPAGELSSSPGAPTFKKSLTISRSLPSSHHRLCYNPRVRPEQQQR